MCTLFNRIHKYDEKIAAKQNSYLSSSHSASLQIACVVEATYHLSASTKDQIFSKVVSNIECNHASCNSSKAPTFL